MTLRYAGILTAPKSAGCLSSLRHSWNPTQLPMVLCKGDSQLRSLTRMAMKTPLVSRGLGSHDLSLITSLSLLLSRPKAQDPFPFPFRALQQMELRSISHTTHPYDVPTSMMLQRNSASLTFMLPLHTTFTVSKLMVQVTLILSVATIAEQAILLCHLQKSRFGLKYAYRTQQYMMRQKYSQHRLFISPLPATPGHLVVMMQLFSMLIIVLHGRRVA